MCYSLNSSYLSSVQLPSRVQVFVTPWTTVAYPAPLPMGFSRQSIEVGCHCFLWYKPKVIITFTVAVNHNHNHQSDSCDPMDHSTSGFPVHHQLPELTQTHVHWVSDAIQPSYPLLSPSSALNLSQHQGLFKWVSSSHQLAKVLEFQLQHHSFQWTPRTDLL